ncbi:hypothetical protein M758_10G041000 [Ceratodon purpureus]|uniref:Uncharacterized protein n=1 Tax=Ceratodon purpureus TaxID=3225 RepID=A0A8T0GJD3_CERPU|nr:hypothetical protein KC19_10G044100 [Ceratodon purpureus]KAG0602790.1 hypothetical protein M758_10G041000 [Ceratodon purpureus]
MMSFATKQNNPWQHGITHSRTNLCGVSSGKAWWWWYCLGLGCAGEEVAIGVGLTEQEAFWQCFALIEVVPGEVSATFHRSQVDSQQLRKCTHVEWLGMMSGIIVLMRSC